MKYLPANTLAYYQAAPQFKPQVLTHVPVARLAKATQIYRQGHTTEVPPTEEAARFYALNHCASIVRARFTVNEVLPAWAQAVMQVYLETTIKQSERLLHYMMCIITREARNQGHMTDLGGKVMAEIEHQSPQMREFLEQIKSTAEMQAVGWYMEQPPAVTAEQYVQAIAHLFDHGKWSSSYGGKNWGNIARTVLKVLTGVTSLETLTDTAYTLAHNGGPMFNKGMLYSSSDEIKERLLMVLDVQRGGQVPELFLDQENWAGLVRPPGIVQIVEQVRHEVPKAIGQYVDWQKVINASPVGEYDHQLSKQQQKHPAPQVQMFMGKPAKKVGEFQVFPGQSVEVYERG